MSAVSGDYCRILPGGAGLVEHYRCDDHRDGTITNCITGETVKAAPPGLPYVAPSQRPRVASTAGLAALRYGVRA